MTRPDRIEAALLRWRSGVPAVGRLVDGERKIPYREVACWSVRFAHELARQGVAPGDRVAIYLDHVAEAVVALHGTWIAGAITVPVNHTLRSLQVAHILRHSGSRVVVSTPRNLERLDAETLTGVRALTVPLCEALGPEEDASLLPRGLVGGGVPAAILYTSGSTGQPKGVLLSHANLRAGARIVTHYLGIDRRDRILGVLPLSFDYGLNQLLMAVRVGCELVLQRSHFPGAVLATLVQREITVLAGVPPFWIQLLPGADQRVELPHLRLITNSGGVFPLDLVAVYRARLPHVRLCLMYGLSEAFRSTYLPPEELERHPGSMGKAIPESDVFVLDVDGSVCADGEPGELVHRGPTVALGYWNDRDASARVFRLDPRDPCSRRTVVYSGDIVCRDEDGYFQFVRRRDQLIKTHGYRVGPEEVESLIRDSHLVSDVVVHGRPDAVAGAVIVAHVVPADPHTFAPSLLLAYCRASMPAYMVPACVEVHERFPRTSSGKVDRKALAG